MSVTVFVGYGDVVIGSAAIASSDSHVSLRRAADAGRRERERAAYPEVARGPLGDDLVIRLDIHITETARDVRAIAQQDPPSLQGQAALSGRFIVKGGIRIRPGQITGRRQRRVGIGRAGGDLAGLQRQAVEIERNVAVQIERAVAAQRQILDAQIGDRGAVQDESARRRSVAQADAARAHAQRAVVDQLGRRCENEIARGVENRGAVGRERRAADVQRAGCRVVILAHQLRLRSGRQA